LHSGKHRIFRRETWKKLGFLRKFEFGASIALSGAVTETKMATGKTVDPRIQFPANWSPRLNIL
jgi:hypothetical protein